MLAPVEPSWDVFDYLVAETEKSLDAAEAAAAAAATESAAKTREVAAVRQSVDADTTKKKEPPLHHWSGRLPSDPRDMGNYVSVGIFVVSGVPLSDATKEKLRRDFWGRRRLYASTDHCPQNAPLADDAVVATPENETRDLATKPFVPDMLVPDVADSGVEIDPELGEPGEQVDAGEQVDVRTAPPHCDDAATPAAAASVVRTEPESEEPGEQVVATPAAAASVIRTESESEESGEQVVATPDAAVSSIRTEPEAGEPGHHFHVNDSEAGGPVPAILDAPKPRSTDYDIGDLLRLRVAAPDAAFAFTRPARASTSRHRPDSGVSSHRAH